MQVSAMKVHFQIAERSLFYLNPDIQHRRMTYPSERGKLETVGIIGNFMYTENKLRKEHGYNLRIRYE